MSKRLAGFTNNEIYIISESLKLYGADCFDFEQTLLDQLYMEFDREDIKRNELKKVDCIAVMITLDGRKITNWSSRHG